MVIINNKGFTLIEVLASLVIISIVLMSFMSIFLQSNKIAVRNNEKLVVVNLADAYLERIKLEPSIISYSQTSPGQILLNNNNCGSSCEFFSKNFNNKEYRISIRASQNANEISLKLINVLVRVEAAESNINSQVEGYIPYE